MRFSKPITITQIKDILPIILALLMLLIAIGGYKELNEATGGMGGLLLKNIVMPTPDSNMTLKTYIKSCGRAVANTIINEPMQYVYQVVPQYKVKNKYLKIYDDEMVGYFNMPASEELISLEEEKLYIPTRNYVEKEQIDVTRFSDPAYMLQKFYMGDQTLGVDTELLSLFDYNELARQELTLNTEEEGPKVLIFHTHSRESYKGQMPQDQGVVTVGRALKEELEKGYGIEVLHLETDFYLSATNNTVNGAYERMEPVITQVLQENPSIELVIDIHRDGIAPTYLVSEINGKPTAPIMFVNGLCMRRDLDNNIVPNSSLVNPYLETNLALSLQAQMQGLTYYPDMMRKIYLKSYRYSTHMAPQSMLIEWGADTNTLEEALNAVEPVADIIAKVFEKD